MLSYYLLDVPLHFKMQGILFCIFNIISFFAYFLSFENVIASLTYTARKTLSKQLCGCALILGFTRRLAEVKIFPNTYYYACLFVSPQAIISLIIYSVYLLSEFCVSTLVARPRLSNANLQLKLASDRSCLFIKR